MVTAADYAAYSRATGIPYPQSPAERAELMPAVRDFRQNQLNSEQNSGFDPVAAVGAGLLGLGVLGGGYALLRQRARSKGALGSGSANQKDGTQFQDNARATAAAVDQMGDMPKQAAASNPVTDSYVADQVRNPTSVNPNNQEIVVNNAEKGADAKVASLRSNPRASYALGEKAVDVAESAAGFNFDAFTDATPANQVGNQASVLKAQRLADNTVQSLVEVLKQSDPVVEVQSEAAIDMARGLTPRQQRMMQDFAYISA